MARCWGRLYGLPCPSSAGRHLDASSTGTPAVFLHTSICQTSEGQQGSPARYSHAMEALDEMGIDACTS